MRLYLLLPLCLLLVGCRQTPLSGTEWRLVAMNGKAPLEDRSSMGEHTITLLFQDAELEGNAGCNSYGGRYEVDGARLRYPGVGIWSTAVACFSEDGTDFMSQEEMYLRTLRQADSYLIAGDRLELMSAGGEPILVFEKSK